MLSQLLLDSTVKTVYCLVRAKSNAEATDRVIESLKTRRLQPFDKSDSRIVCLASDTSRPDLGLRPEVFAALEKEVTMVLHVSTTFVALCVRTAVYSHLNSSPVAFVASISFSLRGV